MTNPAAPTTVLYIEDNASNVRLVEQIVAMRPGFTLLVATTGGIGLYLAREHVPPIILLDLNLPDMSGEAILLQLRDDEQFAATAIIVVSADATPETALRLAGLGATAQLTKPFDIHRLLQLLDRHGSAPAPPSRAGGRSGVLDLTIVGELRELSGSTTDGDARLRTLVEVFLDDAAARVANLAAAADANDVDTVAAVAHSLAGSSASFGGIDLAERCRQLEELAKRGEVDATMVRDIASSFDEVSAALRAEFFDAGGAAPQ